METKKRPENTEARALGTLFDPTRGNRGRKKIDNPCREDRSGA
jgi:hypothetical protein